MMDVWSILIIVFVFQGIFILVSILTARSRRVKTENRVLVLLVIVLLWFLLEFLCIRNKIDFGFSLFYGTRYGSWFLLGPLIFFYFRAITKSESAFSNADLLHFLPFVVFVVFLPLFFEEPLNKRQIDYGMLSVFDHRNKVIGPIAYVYSFVFIGQFLFSVGYLFLSLCLVQQYRRKLREEYSQKNNKVKWLRLFILSFILIFVFTSIFLVLLLKTDIYRRHMDYLYVIPVGLLFYMVGYFLIDENWAKVGTKSTKYAGSTLTQENLSDYAKKFENLIQDETPYLDSTVRLKDLAKRMDISGHHLSQLINQHYNTSFFDFINKHRIETAKKLIKAYPERLLIDIAFEAGFNNKTSFTNSFKKFEKVTPSKFREQLFS